MLTAILVLLLIILLVYYLMKKPKNFPPGPPRWPVIGNLLLFKMGNMMPYQVAQQLKHRYGNIVGFYMASSPTILISGFSEIKDVMSKPEFQGRPFDAVRVLENTRTGLVMADGPVWREQKRFSLRHLRDMGMGRKEVEEKIHAEVNAMISDARRIAGDDWKKSIPVHQLIKASGANIILQLLAGYRFERDDPKIIELINKVKRLTTLINATGGVAHNFPFVLKYLPWLTEYPDEKFIRDQVRNYCRELMSRHKEKLDEINPLDLIDFYLLEIEKNDVYNERQLSGVIEDLFLAGSDTMTGALSFAILYVVLYPEIQRKVQNELDNVVNPNSFPSVNDKQRLPYTEAAVQEILRSANVAPLGIPHGVITSGKSIIFRGYNIPKNSRIIINLYDLHTSEEYWKDPDVFRPERFIDKNGKFIRDEKLLPFGSGKRSCVGESMARMNLFLVFSSLLHKFTLSLPEGEPTPTTEHRGGLTVTTVPFNIIMTPRH